MEQDVLEGNRLIAVFDDGAIQNDAVGHLKRNTFFRDIKFGLYLYNDDMLKYHSLWDWQIPVWGKIALSVKELIPKLPNPEYNTKWYFRNVSQYEKAVFNNKPEDGQKIIVELIEWYNKQSKNER